MAALRALPAAVLLMVLLASAPRAGAQAGGAASPATLPPAAPSSGVALVPVAYHPVPDDADPLGVPYWTTSNRSWDYFQSMYNFYDKDKNGFDFPSLVADGLQLIEGAPGGDYEPTLAAYRAALAARAGVESPLILKVATHADNGTLRIAVNVLPRVPLAERGLVLHWVLAEDDVTFRPPPALSNGVYVHRFTARAIAPARAPILLDLQMGQPVDREATVPLKAEWDPGKLYVAVWVQNEDEGSSRFRFPEVLQATMHLLNATEPTVQARRGVLMEMFTATWCAACKFGDNALNVLAAQVGFASGAYHESAWRYLREPDAPALAAGVAGGALLAAVVLPPGGPPGLAARLRGMGLRGMGLRGMGLRGMGLRGRDRP